MSFTLMVPYILMIIVITATMIGVLIYKKKLENKVGLQFRNQIERHYEEVRNIYSEMRGWRHDFHNHIQTVKGHAALGQYDEMDTYLSKLDMDLESVDTRIKTGNIMADAIINSKVSLAENNGISVNVKARLDEYVRISEVDLCVIIGNLVDNAIDACMLISTPADRFLRIYISKLKKQLYISITNSTSLTERNEKNVFVTTKKGVMHGHGLKRVEAVVNKYDGYLNRQNEPGVFATEIMLPL